MFSWAQQTPLFKIDWEDNHFTYLKDLGKVNLKPKGKRVKQNVQIWRIDTLAQQITYQYEGVLHDISTAEVVAIYPCNQSKHMVIFGFSSAPRIVFADQTISNYARICDFVYSVPVNKEDSLYLLLKGENAPTMATLASTETADSLLKKPAISKNDSNNSLPRYDTIIRPTSVKVRIIIINQTPKILVYRRYDNPSGPIYYVNASSFVMTEQRENGQTFFQN